MTADEKKFEQANAEVSSYRAELDRLNREIAELESRRQRVAFQFTQALERSAKLEKPSSQESVHYAGQKLR